MLVRLKSVLDLEMTKHLPTLRQTAMVSLASLLRMACIDQRTSQLRFPSHLDGPFCRGDARDDLPRRLVHLLSSYLELDKGQGDRLAALSALNILGHSSIIPVVIPLIEGKVNIWSPPTASLCSIAQDSQSIYLSRGLYTRRR